MTRHLPNLGVLAAVLLVAGCASTDAGRARGAGPTQQLLPDGAIYQGELKDGLLHGQGRLRWRNGAEYLGGFSQGLMNGAGRYRYPNGDWCEAEFRDGLLHGAGHCRLANGDEYFGQFADDAFAGEGLLRHASGDVHQGQYRDGAANGPGLLIGQDGSWYAGEFRDGQFHGSGRHELASGDRYAGEFAAGAYHGKGEYLTRQGDRYLGGFVRGEMSGTGRIEYAGGDVYLGEVSGWRMSGEGELRLADGGRYSGGLRDNRFEGQGRLEYADDYSYVGGFRAGRFDGQGTLHYLDDDGQTQTLAGRWENGRFLGEGNGKDREQQPPAAFNAERLLFSQYPLLRAALDQIAPSNSTRPDLYFIAFGGDAGQDVFLHEARYVRELFERRFGAQGRALTLMNNAQTLEDLPLASATNLRAALQEIGRRMDAEQDILFLFLTSHGTQDHALRTELGNLPLEDLRAAPLARMLGEARIKWKVIVISACYSGGFIDALKDPHTLIVTSARADRSSFGCDNDAELTYFGRAFFETGLGETRSFSAAFEQARRWVSELERQEGREFSEPQLWTTPQIEGKLRSWLDALDAQSGAQRAPEPSPHSSPRVPDAGELRSRARAGLEQNS